MESRGQSINRTYILQEKAGQNDIYSTWRAKALYSPNDFSITFLDFSYNQLPDKVFEEFHRIFFAVYSFQSPYIHTPFEYEEFEGRKYLASPWIPGYSLREAIADRLINGADQVINIAIHILRGLAELERIGVRHNSLSPASVILSRAHFEYGIIRLRNVGYSLFIDHLPKDRCYRKVADYLLKGDHDPAGHQRDLYAAGLIIQKMVDSLSGEIQSSSEILDFKNLIQRFYQQPLSFESIHQALDQLLSIHPEKKIVDLIQEHIVTTEYKGTSTVDLYRSMEARYKAFKESMYELHREDDSELPGTDRYPEYEPLPPEQALPDLVPEIEFTPGIEELSALTEEEAQEGLFARTISAIRRLFSGTGKGKSKESKGGFHKTSFFHRLFGRREPGRGYTGATADGTGASGRNGNYGQFGQVDGDLKHHAEEQEASRAKYIFKRLAEHFSGLAKGPTPEGFQDVSRPGKEGQVLPLDKRKGPPLKQTNLDGVQPDDDTTSQPLPGKRGTRGNRTPPGHYLSNTSQDGELSDREGDTSAKDEDFQPGPEYAPGERREGEDVFGPEQDIEFGSSFLQKDREPPEGILSGKTPRTTSESKDSKQAARDSFSGTEKAEAAPGAGHDSSAGQKKPMHEYLPGSDQPAPIPPHAEKPAGAPGTAGAESTRQGPTAPFASRPELVDHRGPHTRSGFFRRLLAFLRLVTARLTGK